MELERLTASCAVAVGNELGEGIVWDDRAGCLYWTDITAARLWRYVPATRDLSGWDMPEPLACLALCEADAWLLLGLASRLAFFHLSDARLVPICAVEPGLPTRLNDGACDREGRFVFGVKHEPPGDGPSEAVGGWYRLDTDLSLHCLPLGSVAIANGLAFSPCGRTMYFCDSPTRVIRCCDYAPDGTVSSAREFSRLAAASGVPDGSTADSARGIWNAEWDLGTVAHYDESGRRDGVVTVPTGRPTRPVLGGPDFRILFITSARDDGEPSGSGDAQGGNVFSVRVATAGVPEARFAGSPTAAD